MTYNSKALATECYADTLTVAMILKRSPADFNKQHGVGSVARLMRDSQNIILGFVDGDRMRTSQIPYFQEFAPVDQYKNVLQRWQHPQLQKNLIVVEPAIERFIMHAAAEAGLDANEHPCLASLDAMKRITKSSELYNNDPFKKLIRDIRRADTPSFQQIENWINECMQWP